MFSVMNRSSSIGGSGMINITTTRTTTPAAIRSVYLPSLLIVPVMLGGPLGGREPAAAGDAVDVGQDLRHGGEQLLGDLLADLDGRVQRARERRVGDDRDVVLGGDLADPQGDQVLALGDDGRRGRVAVVLERHG